MARSMLVACLLVLACSGGGGGSKGSLTVDPSTADVIAGGDPVTFRAVVSGDSGTPLWTLCCSGNDGSLSSAYGMTVTYSPPERVDAVTSVKLVAQLNELQFEVAITVHPAPAASVTGRVVDNLLLPVPGATVAVPGAGPVATTDASGAFTVTGVRVPYDLLVRSSSFVVEYQGLRRLDPTVLVDVKGVLDPPLHARIAGQVSGGSIGSAGYHTRVAFGSPDRMSTTYPDGSGFDASAEVGGAGEYAFVVPLTAPETTGTLYALEYRADAAGRPVEYTGFAVRAGVHLVASTTADGQHLALGAAPGTSSLTGTASTRGLQARLRAKARFGEAWLPLVDAPVTAGAFGLAMPGSAEEVRVALESGDDLQGGWYYQAWRGALMPAATGVSLALVAPPNPVSPADGAVVSEPNVPFVWQLMEADRPIYVVRFEGAGFALTIVTAAQGSVVIPDVSVVGMPSPGPSETFVWNVSGTTALGTMDDAAGPGTYKLRNSSCVWERSGNQSFQTPP